MLDRDHCTAVTFDRPTTQGASCRWVYWEYRGLDSGCGATYPRAVIRTNLILIDGLAGTGKTTLARGLAERLETNEHRTSLWCEFTSPHPLHEWDLLSVDEWSTRTRSNWRRFAEELVADETIGIVESTFFQGSIGQLLEWDAPQASALSYVSGVASLIGTAKPVLIYLVPGEVEPHIRRTYDRRSETWRNKIDGFIQSIEYGRSRNLSGLDGYIRFNHDLKSLSDLAFDAFAGPKFSIDVSGYEFAQYERRAVAWLHSSKR